MKTTPNTRKNNMPNLTNGKNHAKLNHQNHRKVNNTKPVLKLINNKTIIKMVNPTTPR